MNPVETWRGRKARITPSGHIHHIEAVSHRDSFARDVAIMACGKEIRRAHLTLFFPSEGRHCPRCFTTAKADCTPSPEVAS